MVCTWHVSAWQEIAFNVLTNDSGKQFRHEIVSDLIMCTRYTIDVPLKCYDLTGVEVLQPKNSYHREECMALVPISPCGGGFSVQRSY